MNLAMLDTGSILPTIFQFFQANFLESILALLIIFGCLILQKASKSILAALARRTGGSNDENGRSRVLEAIKRPLSLSIILAGLYAALNLFPIGESTQAAVLLLFRSLLAFMLLWWIYNLTSSQDGYVGYLIEERLQVDPALSPVVLNILRVFIVICGVVLIASEWGYDLQALVAGLGLGGLALALAAKEILANLFGGMVILTEKPFKIGDWIQTSSVEGTVEEIGFRSCRFRTAAQALVTVPNYSLTNEAIINWSRIGKKQICFRLRLAITTPSETMRKVTGRIERMLQEHEGIHPETIIVRFDALGEHSMDIYINCFSVTTDLKEHLSVKEDINYRVTGIVQESGAQYMLPAVMGQLEAMFNPAAAAGARV